MLRLKYRPSLVELYKNHTGKLSDKWASYLTTYDRIFRSYRNKCPRLLEIGVQNGGSLEIWLNYFKLPTALVGCDINADCRKLIYEDPRIHLIIGDANDYKTREAILRHCSKFDIIIDDGSHICSDVIKSFLLYFPALDEGGIYIIEDLHASYWRDFEGGLSNPFSSISFLKLLVDIVNFQHWEEDANYTERSDVLSYAFPQFSGIINEGSLAQLHSVEFVNSMCVLRKKGKSDNLLGSRVIAGEVEEVISGMKEHHGRKMRGG